MRKNKALFFVLASLLAVTALFVSCNPEVNNNASGDKSLAYITFDGGNSKRITGTTISESYELVDINELYWVYSAHKADMGGASGQTNAARVNDTTGLSGVIGGFSKGYWDFTLTGWKYDGTGGDPSTDVPTDEYHENYEKIFAGSVSGVILNTGTQLNPDPINVNVSFVPTGTGTLVIDGDFVFQWQYDSGNDSGNLGTNLRLRIAVSGLATPYEYVLTRSTENNEVVYKLIEDKVIENIPAGDYVATVSVIETLGEVPTEDTIFVYAKYEDLDVKIYAGQTTRVTAQMLEGEFAAGQFNAIIESVNEQTVTASVPVTFTSTYTPASATSGNVDTSAITTVEFEADALEPTATDESYKLTVAVSDFATAQSKFVVENGTSAASLNLDLKKYTGTEAGESITTFNENKTAIITSYIAKGLEGVKVVYNGVNQDGYSVDAGYGAVTESVTIPAKEIASDSGLGYNPTTGYLSFKTNHFSEYYVSANAVEALNVRTNVVSSLKSAVDNATDGDTIMLLKDIPSSGILEITKSITVDGNNKSITTSTVDRIFKVTGERVVIKNVSLSNIYNYAYSRCIDIRGNLKNLTISNVRMSSSSPTAQQLTIAYTTTEGLPDYKRNIVIDNCSITGTNNPYSIIVFCPSTITINNSEISGWSNIYFKENSSGSSVNISKSILKANGITGASNSFGLLVFESLNNEVTINNSSIEVSSSYTDTVEAFVTFSEWYAPNTQNTINVTGGDFTLSGGGLSRYVTDKGTFNSLTITECNIDNHGESSSSYTYNSPSGPVAYMYIDKGVQKCDGYYNPNTLIQKSNAASPHFFTNGEWFVLYEDVTLTDNYIFNMQGTGERTFGIKCGQYEFVDSGFKLTIPEGVIIATDIDLSNVFDAPDGYDIVEVLAPSGYTFAYTIAQN